MKKTVKWILLVFFALSFSTSIFAQNRMAQANDPNAIAGPGQAEIIINAENSDRDIAVWVNGLIAAHVRPRTTEKIIVHNGQNRIEAADTQTGRGGQWNVGTRRRIDADSDSNRITIGLTLVYGSLTRLSIQDTAPLRTGAGLALPGAMAASLEDAVFRAAQEIMQDLKENTKVAIVSIAADDPALSEVVIARLEHIMFRTRRFDIVDRRDLDVIRSEINFQLSGYVPDESAVDVGKATGANIVITGNLIISGNTRQLTIRALDVESHGLIAMGRQSY